MKSALVASGFAVLAASSATVVAAHQNQLDLRYMSRVVTVQSAAAPETIRVERVHFAQGANSAIIEGQITGNEIVDYVVGARSGQSMNVSMSTKNGANYFNILAPGQTEVAMFNGSVNENQFEGTLSETGDYKVRVYLMRSAARRNEVAKYRLEIIIGSGEARAAGERPSSSDALVPGTSYHATVTVTKPDGRTRTIVIKNGRAIGCDTSQADPGEFHASRKSDLNIIRCGKERYEIPDAVVQGG